MTGRGIDQILPHPSSSVLHESYVKDAIQYVHLAEEAGGLIPNPVDFAYIWGEALESIAQVAPDLRIINLETSITQSEAYWPQKGIHYRMHPDNIPCLSRAEIDCCVLANNHVLDWGYLGLEETLTALQQANITGVGAGHNREAAIAPAIFEVPGKGRVIVFGFGTPSSGIPSSWAASAEKPGINLLEDFSEQTLEHIVAQLQRVKQPGDIVVASIHWGDNWGYAVLPEERTFAHQLIDCAAVDIIHGHSSHHVKGIEVYHERLILYGCGDFLDDYEGIGGHSTFRADLGLMYFATLNPSTGTLVALSMIPTQVQHFRVNRASASDAHWLCDRLNREGKKFATYLELQQDNTLRLHWQKAV
jgi:poly-gamma-glutamate synthesis protein (capsule biosynthesis protein)